MPFSFWPAPPMPGEPPPDIRDHLALALIPGLGPMLTAAVLERFGSPAAVLRATASQLRTIPLIGDKLAGQFAEAFARVDVAAEWALLQKHGVEAIPQSHDDFPARLRTLVNGPPLLYRRGNLLPSDANCVGIVGSRSCTPYGRRAAEKIAAGLARAGWTVVSGLARGIDGVAHQAALDAGGRTIAVLAGGLARIYPPEHASLADAVAAQGALLTETPMTVAPQPGLFPARNRIISGLSRAVVVVEANTRSGALITVGHAAEQGREVFAVPGPIDSPASAGCLELIRKGSRLVRSADDILEDLQGVASPDGPPIKTAPTLFEPPPTAPPRPVLDAVQQKVWDALASPLHGDELARRAEIGVSELARTLMHMELKRLIRRLPGNQYERRGS